MIEPYVPITGYDDTGRRVWPFLAFNAETLRMRMEWMRETNYTLSQATGYTEDYVGRLNSLRRKPSGKRNSPGYKVLRAFAGVLKCFWIVHDVSSPFSNLSELPPGFDADLGIRWPVLELHPENLKMRMQYNRVTPYHVAQDTHIDEALIADLTAGKMDGVNQDILRALGESLSCIWLVV